LKYIRDGVDDYEYINILKNLGWGSWALGVARTVGPDWRNWTRDTNALESARQQLGNQIELLTGGTPPLSLSVTVTSPSNGAAISGVTPITTTVSSDIVRVEFYVDNVFATDMKGPFSYNLDTRTSTNGPHTITVVAYDAAWNMKIVAVPVSVVN